ncbi:hypothetical protein Q8A73_016450 [Channa argus]|nr:hypothetical protein Q8A73_016450 [Channa argus]
MVTVTSATTSRPNVFPLIQCGSGTGDTVSLGCLATGFTPPSLTFKWTRNGAAVTDFIKYPPVQKGNVYTGVSQIQVTRQDWESSQRFKCAVEHVGGNAQTPEIFRPNGSEPKVTVLPQENMNNPSEITLMCLVSSPVLQDYYITWSEDEGHNNRNYVDGINFPPQKTQSLYLVTSVYTTTKQKWDNNTMFNCNIWPAGRNEAMKPHGVSAANGTSTDFKPSLDGSCTEDDAEEDELSSLWSTASSFIFLFIFSLFYSMIFSLAKMKKS